MLRNCAPHSSSTRRRTISLTFSRKAMSPLWHSSTRHMSALSASSSNMLHMAGLGVAAASTDCAVRPSSTRSNSTSSSSSMLCRSWYTSV